MEYFGASPSGSNSRVKERGKMGVGDKIQTIMYEITKLQGYATVTQNIVLY